MSLRGGRRSSVGGDGCLFEVRSRMVDDTKKWCISNRPTPPDAVMSFWLLPDLPDPDIKPVTDDETVVLFVAEIRRAKSQRSTISRGKSRE